MKENVSGCFFSEHSLLLQTESPVMQMSLYVKVS